MKMNIHITDQDYSAITTKLEEATLSMKNAENLEDVKAAVQAYHHAYTDAASKFARLFVNLYQDVSDENTMAQYGSNVQKLSDLMYYVPFHQAVSESPFYQELLSYCGYPFMELMKFNLECEAAKQNQPSVPPANEETMMRYQSLIVQADGKYEQFADQFDDILQELVENNHALARYCGYQNYCDYANQMNSRFDYDENEILKLCEQVRKLVVPYYQNFKRMYSTQLSGSGPKAKDLLEGMGAYTQHLGSEAKAYWSLLCEKDYLDIKPSPTKMPNMGLQRFIEEEGLGPIVTNDEKSFTAGWVLAHEFGHSFQEYLAYKKQRFTFNIIASPDMMEISSRLMEMFLYVHGPDLYENAQDYPVFHIKSLLLSMINFAMSAEYEHWLYHNVSATKQQRREKYLELYCETHPGETVDETMILRKLYDETTIFTMPKYQFCYVLAWINAVEIIKDYKARPAETYKKFLDLSADLPVYRYKELVRVYDLHNVFEEGVVSLFVDWVEEILSQYKAKD